MRGINLPQTFERRGTTVPLHHKDFAHTRVREYFHGEDRLLEAVIPNYSGTRRGEQVVVPWGHLTDMASFDMRDLRVHELVMATNNTRDLDPINIREICLTADAALSGGTGGGSGAGGAGGRGPHWRVMVGLPMLPAFVFAAWSFLL